MTKQAYRSNNSRTSTVNKLEIIPPVRTDHLRLVSQFPIQVCFFQPRSRNWFSQFHFHSLPKKEHFPSFCIMFWKISYGTIDKKQT